MKKESLSWWGTLKQTGSEFGEDRALRLSAAMAYYAVFSIGPLLFLVVGIAGLVLGEDKVRQEVQQQLQGLLGNQSAGMVESMMTARKAGGTMMATIVGGVGLLLGASGVFGQLQDALNTIWEVQQKPGGGVWSFIRTRFLSFGMVLVIGFLLLLSMVLTTVVQSATGSLTGSMPGVMAEILNFAASFIVISV